MALRRLTEELVPGMVLNEDIYNRDSILLLASGAVLCVEKIQIIKRLGYKDVSIKETENCSSEKLLHLDPKFLHFQKSYQESRDEVIRLVRYISDGNNIDIEHANCIPRSILKDFGSHSDLFAYMSMVTRLDDHTYGHCINVSLICSLLCQWLNLPADVTRDAVVAGLLHNIGKTRINQAILKKRGRLATQEWEEIKKHTIYGYQILVGASTPGNVSKGVLYHHEREDGYGYPNGLTGPYIPVAAKIVSIADMYDAMTADRPYRGKICPFKVMEEFQYNCLGSLDIRILMTFLNRIAECYLGETIRLNDGRDGMVVFINPVYPSRPMIQLTDGCIINLKFEPEIWIESILSRDHQNYS